MLVDGGDSQRTRPKFKVSHIAYFRHPAYQTPHLSLDPLLLVLGLGLAHLLPEQVLGVGPYLGALPFGQLEERGDEVLAELFRGFPGQLQGGREKS